MIRQVLSAFFIIFTLGACQSSPPVEDAFSSQNKQAYANYQKNCASCHGAGRLGVTGPALIPEGLERVKKADAVESIKNGRPLTQMPAFKETLSDDQIKDLVEWLYTEQSPVLEWGENEIKNSRFYDQSTDEKLKKPPFQADPLNLFFVVELAGPRLAVLDGDRFEVIHRFEARAGIHGGVKYSPDGKWAYALSRDGWVTKYDVFRLKKSAEIRVGLNSRNIALSQDGRYLIAGNTLPQTLVILDAHRFEPLKVIPVKSIKDKPSRVSAVYVAPPRESFIVALKDVPEVWEISYKDGARPPYTGLVHDFRAESGEDISTAQQKFPIRRIQSDVILDDFFFDQKYYNILGSSRHAKDARVVNLIVGRPTHQVPVSGMPHLGSGITFKSGSKTYLATPNLKENQITVIDQKSWKIVEQIKTLGPGFFLRSHKNAPHIWADVFFGKDKDAIHVIDKKNLKIVRTLRPLPGKTAAHVEFTRDGRYALVSVWEDDGAIVVYDSRTLEEVTRIPMRKPSGKYNIANKISFEEGTSH